jgi:hypothetical protein
MAEAGFTVAAAAWWASWGALRGESGNRRNHDRRTTRIIAVTILFTLMVDSFRVQSITIKPPIESSDGSVHH